MVFHNPAEDFHSVANLFVAEVLLQTLPYTLRSMTIRVHNWYPLDGTKLVYNEFSAVFQEVVEHCVTVLVLQCSSVGIRLKLCAGTALYAFQGLLWTVALFVVAS